MICTLLPPLDQPGLADLIQPGADGPRIGLDDAGRARLARLAEVLGWEVAVDGAVRAASALPGATLVALAGDILTLPADRPATAIRARLPAMTLRAEARLRAGGPDPRVRIAARREAYAGFFAVEDMRLRHPRFDGSLTPPLERTAFVGADACVVLPYDATRDRVLLIEQFRPGAFARGDANPWMIETVAGRIDAGETPEAAARREAREEAGIDLGPMIALPGYYPSPAAMTEFLYSFIAAADLPDTLPRHGGLADEGEDIRLIPLPLAEAVALIDAGGIRNAPLMIVLTTLWRDREAIRRRFGVEGTPASP